MANTINFAEKWRPEIIKIFNQQTLSSPFLTSNVEWLNAKTFHFTQMSTSGYKVGNRDVSGVQRGDVTQTDVPFTLTHEREIEFALDVKDIDESGGTFTPANVTKTFLMTQSAPEIDAFFFSKVATTAEALGADNFSATALATYTKTTVYGLLKAQLASTKLRRYRQMGALIMYTNSTIMDLLEQSEDFTRDIEMTQISDGGGGLETRVTSIDGTVLIEVIDDERFFTAFDFTEGFVAAIGSFALNTLIATPMTTKTIPKINTIFLFGPGQHQQGNGWLYQNFAFWDTFIFPNGKDNVIDSIFIDRDTTAVT